MAYTTSTNIQHYTFHLSPTHFLKKERASKVLIHLQDKVEMLLDILDKYELSHHQTIKNKSK